jgi:transposase-like protein
VCRKCGISRPTLRKWLKRYVDEGMLGLEDSSRCPKNNLTREAFEYQGKLILNLRLNRKLGVLAFGVGILL